MLEVQPMALVNKARITQSNVNKTSLSALVLAEHPYARISHYYIQSDKLRKQIPARDEESMEAIF